MNKNLTELVLVVDCSASMEDIKKEAEAGINKLLKEQSQEEGECRLTLVEFSNTAKLVYSNIDLKSIDGYRMKTISMTALYDGVGLAIDTVGDRLAKTDEKERPGLVIVAVVTDGLENCSRKYNKSMIREKISEQTEKYSWVFDYLCNDPVSAKNAESLNFGDVNVANVKKSKQMYSSLSGKVGRLRKATSRGVTGDELQAINRYTAIEKEEMA